jgi:polysaccharide export outer membrane protein
VLHLAGGLAAAGEPPATDADSGERPYLIGPDDKLSIVVHNDEKLSAELVVGRDGSIVTPVGEVKAAGLTPRDLAAKLAELLDRRYLVDPRVTVEVEEYRSQWVMVTGPVFDPGKIVLRGGTRLKEVLSEAGGFREEAGSRITISRRSQAALRPVTIVIDRERFDSGEANPILAHGDIIEVAPRATVYVQGEVRSPGGVPFEQGMTLLRALSIAGGLSEWADR